MKKYSVTLLLLVFLIIVGLLNVSWISNDEKTIKSDMLSLRWERKSDGWHIAELLVKSGHNWTRMTSPDGGYTLLYSVEKPDTAAVAIYNDGKKVNWPEPSYRHTTPHWKEVTNEVNLNTAGKAYHFYPKYVEQSNGKVMTFFAENEISETEATWQIDPKFPTDILVKITIKAKKDGYFSIASPSLTSISNEELKWGMIPGYFQGAAIEKDIVKSYAYGQGIPDRPIVVRERTASTLSPLISLKNGVTLAVIPEPGTGRDPWAKDKNTHNDWLLGLSLMNRKSDLSPTAYHPVLGEKGSYLRASDTTSFTFRYSLQSSDWFHVLKHAIYDIYRFKDFLALKETKQSLTDRVIGMYKYLMNDSTSMWRTEQYKGLTIGGQAYLGSVLGSDKDAMKNSDYGAMWMLSHITNDTLLRNSRLPFARNFKLLQQQTSPGFLQGAAVGQYFLSKSKKFTEEWGPYVEPIGLTYYTMMDIGNILLFEPEDKELKARLKQGAERLLEWQGEEGNWAVAYDRVSEKQLFTELEDLRPTFYGLVVAYRILGDKRYLEAACRGADWYIKNAIEKGSFLGVCGDNRFVQDFATGQSSQALLDLYDLSKNKTYLEAAIKVARFYTTSIYTHPIPSREVKMVKGVSRQDWEISQVGLSFEHGGSVGSANPLGPILLSSHAGLFVRIYQLTKDSLYLDMARAAALGRDAFIDKKTNVASYYWQAMDRGPGSFPHHAWWQIGWITDYILAETQLRSQNRISFPRGFITPKVGPHQSYGFASGEVYGNSASLILGDGILKSESPYLDYVMAMNSTDRVYYLIMLNNDDNLLKTKVHFDFAKIPNIKNNRIKTAEFIKPEGPVLNLEGKGWNVEIPPYGLKVIEIKY